MPGIFDVIPAGVSRTRRHHRICVASRINWLQWKCFLTRCLQSLVKLCDRSLLKIANRCKLLPYQDSDGRVQYPTGELQRLRSAWPTWLAAGTDYPACLHGSAFALRHPAWPGMQWRSGFRAEAPGRLQSLCLNERLVQTEMSLRSAFLSSSNDVKPLQKISLSTPVKPTPHARRFPHQNRLARKLHVHQPVYRPVHHPRPA